MAWQVNVGNELCASHVAELNRMIAQMGRYTSIPQLRLHGQAMDYSSDEHAVPRLRR